MKNGKKKGSFFAIIYFPTICLIFFIIIRSIEQCQIGLQCLKKKLFKWKKETDKNLLVSGLFHFPIINLTFIANNCNFIIHNVFYAFSLFYNRMCIVLFENCMRNANLFHNNFSFAYFHNAKVFWVSFSKFLLDSFQR